jgi:hypothetical protein
MAADGLIRPDFIIIGSMKSGTTSLYRSLSAHPDISMSRDKETDFFVAERSYNRGFEWYSRQFDATRPVRGEASPNYTKVDDFRGVPERIKAFAPDVRLIYMVRDPVSRFVSQYRHSWTMGDIAMTPAELPATHEYTHILNVSRYAHQVRAFLECFDRERLLIVDFDQLLADKAGEMARIHRFIGVAPHDEPEVGQFNDNAEISRVPAPLLRFAQSPAGRAFSLVLGRETRDRIRGLLARGKPRQPAPFPPAVMARIRDDLRADAAAFRHLTGMEFATWSI